MVNGPGEAREADLGIAAGQPKGHLFIKGKIVRVVPEDEMVEALVDEAEEARGRRRRGPSRGGRRGAEAEAEADRKALLEAKGADVNHAGERIEMIRKTIANEQEPHPQRGE